MSCFCLKTVQNNMHTQIIALLLPLFIRPTSLVILTGEEYAAPSVNLTHIKDNQQQQLLVLMGLLIIDYLELPVHCCLNTILYTWSHSAKCGWKGSHWQPSNTLLWVRISKMLSHWNGSGAWHVVSEPSKNEESTTITRYQMDMKETAWGKANIWRDKSIERLPILLRIS